MKGPLDKYLTEIQKPIKQESVILAITGASLAMAAYNFYKENMSKAARYCSDFHAAEKTKCLLSYNMRAHKNLVSDINSSKSKCKDEACRKSLDKKLLQLREKEKILQAKLNSVMSQQY